MLSQAQEFGNAQRLSSPETVRAIFVHDGDVSPVKSFNATDDIAKVKVEAAKWLWQKAIVRRPDEVIIMAPHGAALANASLLSHWMICDCIPQSDGNVRLKLETGGPGGAGSDWTVSSAGTLAPPSRAGSASIVSQAPKTPGGG